MVQRLQCQSCGCIWKEPLQASAMLQWLQPLHLACNALFSFGTSFESVLLHHCSHCKGIKFFWG